jgi:hypothetical protein
MAYVIGITTEAERRELKLRGWDIEPAPESLLPDEPLEPGQQMVKVFVDTDLFTVMSGPDWDTAHVAYEDPNHGG